MSYDFASTVSNASSDTVARPPTCVSARLLTSVQLTVPSSLRDTPVTAYVTPWASPVDGTPPTSASSQCHSVSVSSEQESPVAAESPSATSRSTRSWTRVYVASGLPCPLATSPLSLFQNVCVGRYAPSTGCPLKMTPS